MEGLHSQDRWTHAAGGTGMKGKRCPDDWPAIEAKHSDVTIPKDSIFELVVVPCGEESWVPELWIWPEVLGLKTDYLDLQFEDCLDFSNIIGKASLSLFSSPASLVRDVGVALADFLAEHSVLKISNTRSASGMEISLRSKYYESKCFCDFGDLVKALHGEGFTQEEISKRMKK